MANAKKCDRCGRYYDSNVLSAMQSAAAALEKLKRSLQQEAVKQIEENVDLCPQCVNSLKRWYKGKDGEAHE